MFEGSGWSKTLDLLQRTMDVALLRREVISNNIANVNTPNFKRSEVSFEAQLGRALASEQQPRLELLRDDERHLNPFQAKDYRQVQPRRSLDYLSEVKNNGNNVDIQAEGAAALTNTMRYDLMSQMARFQLSQIRSILA